MPSPGLQRRLVLLRHAKAAYPHGVPDHERPLRGRGRRNARAVGRWFLAEGPRPDLVLCSDAVRAVHTWELVAASLTPPPPVRREPGLYEARPDDVVELVRSVPPELRTVVAVGHEPVMSVLTLALATPEVNREALRQVGEKYPTNGIAVLRLRSGWADLARGTAVLETFAVPRA
jgi:phosphohistidine phosphatase